VLASVRHDVDLAKTSLTFLGTGNFLAPGRYWNSFVLDGSVLVEPSPCALPHLRRCGLPAEQLDAVVISHFHADHTFGWPFLLLELLATRTAKRPLFVVGPPQVEAFLAEMTRLGGVPNIQRAAHEQLDLRYVEVDGSWQDAGPLRFRAIEVEHVPHLRCFGYLFDRRAGMIGYSGDTRPCAGLEEVAGASDVLVLECNGPHPPPRCHMDIDAVRSLRASFPAVPFVLTHLGTGIDASGIPDVITPEDFETLSL
jgi:ribonuclease BN (tRNA processing enzyme)